MVSIRAEGVAPYDSGSYNDVENFTITDIPDNAVSRIQIYFKPDTASTRYMSRFMDSSGTNIYRYFTTVIFKSSTSIDGTYSTSGTNTNNDNGLLYTEDPYENTWSYVNYTVYNYGTTSMATVDQEWAYFEGSGSLGRQIHTSFRCANIANGGNLSSHWVPVSQIYFAQSNFATASRSDFEYFVHVLKSTET